MTVNELLSEFGELIGIPELEWDDEDGCSLSFDEVEVDLEHDAKRRELLITSPLGRLPDGSDAQSILTANFQNGLTGPGSLGWNTSTERLVFLHRMGIENLDGEGLELALREILDRIHFWAAWLQRIGSDDSPSAEHTQPENAIRI